MYLWRRRATAAWFETNHQGLHQLAGPRIAVIELCGCKRLRVEVASNLRRDLRRLERRFGGQTKKLPRDWLEQFARAEGRSQPLQIGRRLIISKRAPVSSAQEKLFVGAGRQHPARLFIPAGAAFGTGQHASTAMCLRLLARVLRSNANSRPPHLMVDLGTGSGILALAARRLGAARAIGIDSDPTAVSTAKENARQNRIEGVQFKVADVLRWQVPQATDLVTANLFSELLVKLLPRLRGVPWLILAGLLRIDEAEFTRALQRNQIRLSHVSRRGKWIAVLAKN